MCFRFKSTFSNLPWCFCVYLDLQWFGRVRIGKFSSSQYQKPCSHVYICCICCIGFLKPTFAKEMSDGRSPDPRLKKAERAAERKFWKKQKKATGFKTVSKKISNKCRFFGGCSGAFGLPLKKLLPLLHILAPSLSFSKFLPEKEVR